MPTTLDRVSRCVAEILGITLQQVNPEVSFGGHGADSLDEVEFVLALQEEFDISISMGDAEDYRERSLKDITGRLEILQATSCQPTKKKETKPKMQSEGIPVTNGLGGVKNDGGKPRWGLLPYNCVTEIVKVLTFGSQKYEDNNWQKVEPNRYKDSAGRHWAAYMSGEKLDPETGLHHLAHMGCNVLFLLWFELKGEKK